MSDPAMFSSGHDRVELDHYPTPEWVTEALVETYLAKTSHNRIWEPAAGTGAISKILESHGKLVYSTDIQTYGFCPGGVDFLKQVAHPCTAIITNPPYGDLAEQFIRHSLELMKPVSGAVAMLLRHEYDTASGRIDLFQDKPFHQKIVLTTRPRWIPGTNGAPRHSYAWYIWDYELEPAPTVYYKLQDKSRNKAYGE